MNVLVIDDTGFIGRRLMYTLLEGNHIILDYEFKSEPTNKFRGANSYNDQICKSFDNKIIIK